jgi:hypothetical protein
MSRTTIALIVKFLLTTIFGALAFRSLGNSWGMLLMVAVLGTALNYLLGDLVILPATNNVVASIADGLLAAVTAYAVDKLSPAFRTSFGSLLLFGVLIAVGEFFFHRYLVADRKVAP